MRRWCVRETTTTLRPSWIKVDMGTGQYVPD